MIYLYYVPYFSGTRLRNGVLINKNEEAYNLLENHTPIMHKTALLGNFNTVRNISALLVITQNYYRFSLSFSPSQIKIHCFQLFDDDLRSSKLRISAFLRC